MHPLPDYPTARGSAVHSFLDPAFAAEEEPVKRCDQLAELGLFRNCTLSMQISEGSATPKNTTRVTPVGESEKHWRESAAL
jgi:hypothetical protein